MVPRVARIVPPRELEVARTGGVADLSHVLDVVVPAAFVPAEAAQGTNGASNGRFEGVFEETATGGEPSGAQSCLVVTDDPRWESGVRDALTSRGVKVVGIGAGAPATDFVGAAEQLRQAVRDAGDVDAVVRGPHRFAREPRRRGLGSRCSRSTRASSMRSAATSRGCGR